MTPPTGGAKSTSIADLSYSEEDEILNPYDYVVEDDPGFGSWLGELLSGNAFWNGGLKSQYMDEVQYSNDVLERIGHGIDLKSWS